MLLLSGSSNRPLADSLAQALNISPVAVEIDRFSNGEKKVTIKSDVYGQNIILVQSFSQPVDENIMEFLLLADALERMGARHVNAIIPWLGYSLQDKVFTPGEPMSAKVVADLISSVYIKRVVLMDLHNNSIPGFFSVPTQLLSAKDIFVDYVKQNLNQNLVVCSPDFGGLKRARDFATALGVDLVNIDKQRDLATGAITSVSVHGAVTGKNVVLYDDCIVGGGTVVETAKVLKEQGAVSVHFLATHGLLVQDAPTKLMASMVDSVVITNSVAHDSLPAKFKVLDVAPVLASVMKGWI